MPIPKKTTTKTAKAAPESESLEESVAREEKRPPVTQVVEVLEDSVESPVEHASAPQEESAKGKTIEELMSERTSKQEPSVEEPIEETAEPPKSEIGEKRKVVVDELFTQKEMSSRDQDVMPEISIHKKRGIPPVVIWSLFMILITVLVGFLIITATGGTMALPFIVPVATPTPTPTSIPTPTPTPAELPRDAVTIQVLNGGGVGGAASKMKALLEEKGYTVSDTGNTDTYDYEKTEIIVKPDSEGYLPQLEKDLGESYVIGSSSATLSEDEDYDVRIIVGKE